MNEDERYRLSTQYRYWSYTPSSLASQRETTNRIATERVKAAILRARVARAASSGLSGDTSEVEALGGRVNDVKMSENGASGSESGSRSGSAGPGGEARFIEGEADVNCLTAEEELKLVAFYSRQTIQLGDHLKLPTEVKVSYVLLVS
jgi:cyclin H